MEGLTIVGARACIKGADVIQGGESLLSAPRILVDAGCRAVLPDMPSLDTIDYLTSTSVLNLDIVPRQLVVVGGSYIGFEFAQIYRRFGAEVTVVERGSQLFGREDEDVSAAVKEIPVGEGAAVHTGATCIGFKRHSDGVAVPVCRA